MLAEKSAGAVVFRKERGIIKYLLLRYELGHWDFPKGWIESKEDPLETARREIKEETGINDVEFVPNFKKTIKYFFQWRGKKIFKTVTLFLAQTKTKRIKISYEHTGYKWLPYEKALRQLTYNNAKKVIKKADFFLQR